MFVWCGMAIAVGVMYKSVIGLLAMPIFLIFSLVYKKWDWLKQGWFWFGMALMLVLILPWHIYESLLFGKNFWNTYLFYHVLHRFAVSLGNVTTLDYIKYLFLLLEPWIITFFIAAAWLFWRYRKKLPEPKTALAAFYVSIFLFLFFVVSRSKLLDYLMPIYPFLAIFLAETGVLFFNFLKTANQKNWFLVCLIFLLLLGLGNTVWQKIYLRKGITLEYKIAEEEKQVGVYLKDHPSSEHAYFFLWPWWETVKYYSDRNIENISQGDIIQPYRQFVIVPAGLWNKNNPPPDEFISRAHLIFRALPLNFMSLKRNKNNLESV